MGRVIAAGPGGKAQAPERDDRALPVIAWVHRAGLLGRKVASPPCDSFEIADELRRALYRSARYFCSCERPSCTRKFGNIPGRNKDHPAGGCPRGGQRVSCRADVVRHGRKWRVEFTLWDKQESIRQVIASYGPDPSRWPYLARAKELRE